MPLAYRLLRAGERLRPSSFAARLRESLSPDRTTNEAVARTITEPIYQVRALVDIAKTLAGAGEHQRAAAIGKEAEAVVRSIAKPLDRADSRAFGRVDAFDQGNAQAGAAEALAQAGQYQEAEAVACSIADPGPAVRYSSERIST